jgi:1-acyl-sn-glycerol-3-phosphate acyltransferase
MRTVKALLNLFRVLPVAIASTVWHGIRIVQVARRTELERDPRLVALPKSWTDSLLRAGGVRVEMEGLENLVEPAVLVCNHVSWYDVFALVSHLPVDARFVGKKEIVKIPFFGPAWLAAGHIPIDRTDRRAAIRSLERAGETLREHGGVVVMFPEGTRSADGGLRPFKKGAFMLALQLGVPVIPAAVSGSREIMRKGSMLVHPGTMKIRIGAPIPVEGLTVDDRDVLVERAHGAVRALAGGGLTIEGREEGSVGDR